MSGEKKDPETSERTSLDIVRDSEFVAACTVIGAAIGAGITKLVQITTQLEYSEWPGATVEIPIVYPTVGSAIAGAVLSAHHVMSSRDKSD